MVVSVLFTTVGKLITNDNFNGDTGLYLTAAKRNFDWS